MSKLSLTLTRLPGHLRQRVKRILQDLRRNPRPSNAEELHDKLAGHYKVKLGDWRIVYRIEEDILTVVVVKVGRKSGPEFYQSIN
ncbi:MAG: type II toxin-antitoxin system mRNA interferase toxin, RelE/StbE family [Caldilineaceae bacterium]